MMNPERTECNSQKWKIWHSVNYVMGSISFLLGSILLYPYFSKLLEIGLITACFFIVGSFTFTLADFTQWVHYQKKIVCNKGALCCQFRSFSINSFSSLAGSFIYLLGSTLFIPSMDKLQIGLYLFIAGSIVIVVSQSWKVHRGVKDGKDGIFKRNMWQKIKENDDGLIVDIFVGVGGALYLAGSILFFNSNRIAQILAATTFSCGGLLFCISGAFMLHRYFFKNKSDELSKQEINLLPQN